MMTSNASQIFHKFACASSATTFSSRHSVVTTSLSSPSPSSSLLNRPKIPSLSSFATTATATTVPSSKKMSSTTTTPIVEFRQYQLHPSLTTLYAQKTIQSSPLRKSHLPLALFAYPETGSTPLNTAMHLYHYPRGLSQRADMRSSLAREEEWKEYLASVKSCMMVQSSGIFVEAMDLVRGVEGVRGLKYYVDNDNVGSTSSTSIGSNSSNNNNNNKNNNYQKSIIELRKYQLQLGYDTVPKFLQYYSKALPFKLKAPNTHPTTELVTVLVSDVGSLNSVIEVWKHGGRSSSRRSSVDGVDDGGNNIDDNDTTTNDIMHCGMVAMEQSRQASRGVQEWREGIAEIAKLTVSFESSILKPSEFSPLQ